MKLYLKLDGENIIGHDYKVNGDYNVGVDAERLVDSQGNYKYKYVGGELIELSQTEIESHPNYVDKENSSKFSTAKDLILTRVAAQEVIDSAQAPQRLKDKAQAIKTKANQALVELFGL